MAKKDDMDHMRSILAHPHSVTPARMPQRDSGISASDAAAMNKAFGSNIKPGTKPTYNMPQRKLPPATSMQTGKPIKITYK